MKIPFTRVFIAKLRSAEAQEDEAVEAAAEKDGNEDEDEDQEAVA